MEKRQTGVIRKLIIGENPKDAMAYEVGRSFGSPVGELKIVEIVEDQNSYYFFGNIRYLIYVEKTDKSVVVWKYFERMPVSVECSL